jgi:hypothetical protein
LKSLDLYHLDFGWNGETAISIAALDAMLMLRQLVMPHPLLRFGIKSLEYGMNYTFHAESLVQILTNKLEKVM